MEKNNYTLEEFKERYLKWHEEFYFCYKNYQIRLVKDGDNKFLYTYTSLDNVTGKNFTSSKEYTSPKLLLENADFFGKKFEEIWNDIYSLNLSMPTKGFYESN